MRKHKEGEFPLDRLITYYDVAEYEKAIADTEAGRTVKAVLKWC